MVFFLRKSGANTVVRIVAIVVEVAVIVIVQRVVRIVTVRRTTLPTKVMRTPYKEFLYV